MNKFKNISGLPKTATKMEIQRMRKSGIWGKDRELFAFVMMTEWSKHGHN